MWVKLIKYWNHYFVCDVSFYLFDWSVCFLWHFGYDVFLIVTNRPLTKCLFFHIKINKKIRGKCKNCIFGEWWRQHRDFSTLCLCNYFPCALAFRYYVISKAVLHFDLNWSIFIHLQRNGNATVHFDEWLLNLYELYNYVAAAR